MGENGLKSILGHTIKRYGFFIEIPLIEVVRIGERLSIGE
jgi:hypothetical protein